MKQNISRKITDSLVNAGIVPSEEKELYEYGIRQGIIMIINLATVILIGIILGMLVLCIVFMVAYIPIRTYAGGYHAGTQLTCYLLSIPFMLISLIAIKLIPWNIFICIMILLFVSVVLYRLVPVEDLNKPLDKIEVAVYRRKALIIASFLYFTSILLWLLGLRQVSASIIMALLMISQMLILGAFKNSKAKHREARTQQYAKFQGQREYK
ncbi:MAG: accessory gene regulator ArgB-like protein [Anaerovoracaceae bacterium]|jgi:accessory gene regulator B